MRADISGKLWQVMAVYGYKDRVTDIDIRRIRWLSLIGEAG
jgi:hypothetical protein